MIKTYYKQPNILEDMWEGLVIKGLPDIFSFRWPTYVLEEIAKEYPSAEITDIFGGSQYDCDWFKDHNLKSHIVDRSSPDYPFASASMIRDMLTYHDKRWMDYVPECNWRAVAKKFNRLEMVED
jgi:hypothetical protein